MIAASDPLEYIPRGRQQKLRHPGPPETHKNACENDDFLLEKLEKVSLIDSMQDEWWTIRRTPSTITAPSQEFKDTEKCDLNKTNSMIYRKRYSECSENVSFRSEQETSFNKFGKRMSEVSTSEGANKRMSVDLQQQLESKVDETVKKPDFSQSKFRAKSDPNYMEDELYIKGHTVIWSRGLVNNFDNLDNSRKTICCYTTQSVVKQALWCKFYWERPVFNDIEIECVKIHEPTGTPIDAVCITDSHNVKVFTPKGEDFTVAIPFVINKLWCTKFGIFIEKENKSFPKENLYECPAVLYSLSHPLDYVCPVITNHSGNVNLACNNNYIVVFTSESPSICVIYDSSLKQHNVFYIRKVKPVELDLRENLTHSVTSFKKLSSKLSIWDNVTNKAASPLITNHSKTGPVSVPHRPQSSMAVMSRCQSPTGSSLLSPWLPHFSNLNATKTPSKSYFDFSKTVSYMKSNPEICLEHIWTDTYVVQNGPEAGPASKVFLIDDLVGQWYLCYVLSLKFQLAMVKVDFVSCSNINFGVSMSISAKDAVPIPHLHMIAVLDHYGNISLYSGLMSVGKLHVGGTLAQHTPSPCVKSKMQKYYISPVLRRSSLLPNLGNSTPNFDEHLLSPVLPTTSNYAHKTPKLNYHGKTILTGLMDAVENRITLKYSDSTFYRLTLPSLVCSTLVENCLTALRQVLQSDISIVVLTRWYATRNIIGCQILTPCEEWELFTNLLLELLGYEENLSNVTSEDAGVIPSPAMKKPKNSHVSDDDWNYLETNSKHKLIEQDLFKSLQLNTKLPQNQRSNSTKTTVNTKSVLFNYIRVIHFALHLLYEDIKLNTLRSEDLPLLVEFLFKLSCDINLDEYKLYYWHDFPNLTTNFSEQIISQTTLKNTVYDAVITNTPISVMKYIHKFFIGDNNQQPYPYIPNVNTRSRDIIQLCGVLSHANRPNSEVPLQSFVKEVNILNLETTDLQETFAIDKTVLEQIVLMMVDMKITTNYLDTLPFGVYYSLYNALWKIRENPPSDWPAEAYYLLWREDLAAQAIKIEKEKQETTHELLGMYSSTQLEDVMPGIKTDSEQLDGMEDIDNSLTKLRFSEDVRVNEARKMLQSSKPTPIVLTQRPDMSDHDFIEEQEKHLYGICIRTMALPVGRGMFTLRTATPVITEPLPAPPLCLTGKASPRGITVDLNHIDTPPNMNMWPLFHNGVANGLRITPDAHNIDNTWIIFNKAKGGDDLQMEHAGFLLALGLNGHLKNLAFNSTFNYLEKLHEMTSVGILLGLSAAFRGTCHPCLTKTLAIHVEALLPPTSMEIDVPQNLQVAGILGIGLLYQETAHRHMTEMLLSEIGRPPGPEMENSVDRESYSLAAGLSLGLVTLRYGERPAGLSDLNIPDTLHYYMVGGNRRPITGSQTDRYRTPSFQIREGSSVNLDVTAPGATLALGLMYLGTGNKAIADWMAPPQTQYLLDFVRPDFLLLRILARSLIMWNYIEPSKDWVENQVPSTIRPYCLVEPNPSLNIDYEAMNQAYCNIVAGACFALGLKFAGTADDEAFKTLLYFCHMFTSLTTKSIAELAGKSTIETCLNVVLLSTSMVMAGTGNLQVMRLVRHLRRRVGVSNSPIVTYGTHLAIHMALGLLFLGGGRYTLSNTPGSVAALICAFYPKFPTHSNDNRYHLQAVRHLYVLAVEPRLIIPKEINSGEICYANLKICKLNGVNIDLKAPCIIPDLSALCKVAVEDERYWPVLFERGRNWELLEKILSTTGYIEVKQRAGCLSYVTDKYGYRSQLARTLTHSEVMPWDPSPTFITMFTSEKSIKLFCKQFLKTDKNTLSKTEERLKQALSKITYEAVVKDKLIVIPVFMGLIKIISDLKSEPASLSLWQFKIIMAQVFGTNTSKDLISKEIILSLQQEVIGILDSWEDELKELLQKYVQNENFIENTDNLMLKKLAFYVNFYDIPNKINISCNSNSILELFVKLKDCGLKTETIQKLLIIEL